MRKVLISAAFAEAATGLALLLAPSLLFLRRLPPELVSHFYDRPSGP